ncbi:hypothetical protein ACJIZ3_018383 [Penstemon smallii]|uniref:Uncharacterized protein n=1 Tax=Penstemon smallii TaxID=265156 RepID=A0ABD3SY73_9LAMI
MNPSKIEEDLFHHLGPPPSHHEQFLDPHHTQSHPPSVDDDATTFSLAEIDIFRDDDEDDDDVISHTSSDAELPIIPPPIQNPNLPNKRPVTVVHHPTVHISPDPHISSQFYTFNKESHALMTQCLVERRLATPEEIRAATPPPVLSSWRSVWKDRNEDTAYLTAWKRIQDKLTTVHLSSSESASESSGGGNNNNSSNFICFKNNCNQFVSHVDQWQDIVMSFHGDGDFKHLGLKETIERIKQVWTVGAKFYGIPESYIRTCVAACGVCSDESNSSGCAPRSKRRRFEYTESFDLPAKEVPVKLQQLAAKHKVVLCIRQKYIRYKPFMAEVKDYACHRAGEPASSSKKSRILKREPYTSKRCGCGFRIRAILPISNYNDKDKTFVYEEEGTAVFKLYAVHSGHEPGPLDGNARIMHRMVGHKGGFLMDHDTVYGMADEGENEGFGFLGKDSGDLQHSVLQQVQELRNELGLLEGRIGKIPSQLLGSVSRELFEIVNKLRNVTDDGSSRSVGLLSDKQHMDDVLVVEHDLPDWGDDHHTRIYGDGKDVGVIEDDEDSFGRTLGEVASWDQMRTECRNEKDLLGETCKEEKWLKCGAFDEKGILGCSNPKLNKTLRHDEAIDQDVGLAGIPVDGFYPENPKWFDSPCGLDPGADCGDDGFQHGEIV